MDSRIRLGIFEYCCGGGLGRDGPQSACAGLISEGRSMLLAAVEDLSSCSELMLTVPVDDRLMEWNDHSTSKDLASWHSVNGESEFLGQWIEVGRACHLVLVIAPELDGILARIIRELRRFGIQVIAGDEPFIDACCDKLNTYRFWNRHNILTPTTIELSAALSMDKEWSCSSELAGLEQQGWVVKRRDGAGCEGIRRFQDWCELQDWTAELLEHENEVHPHSKHFGLQEKYLVQPFVRGTAASIVHLGKGENGLVLKPGVQDLRWDDVGTASYLGGSWPISNIDFVELREQVYRWLNALPGSPDGWIGIDFLVAGQEQQRWLPIEVNPRLTSSYLGLRQAFDRELLLHAIGKRNLSGQPAKLNEVRWAIAHER